MMRTQIQLDSTQHERLRKIAHRRGLSLAALIRRWVDEKLAEGDAAPSRDSQVRDALSVLGKYSDPDGAGDVATEHDRYLAEAFGR